MVNETRVQFTNSNLSAPPSDPIGPAVSISGVASFGTLSGSPTGRVNRLYEGIDNLSIQQGAHAIRVGVDFLYNDDTITFPRTIRGSYSFSSLANFLSGVYNSSGFTQTFGVTQVHQTNPNVGFYAQDEWKVTRSLTLNLGLRYDLQFLQDDRDPDRQRFAARRFRVDSVCVAPDGDSRRLRAVLRPHSAAAARQRAAFGGQHDGRRNLQQLSISLSPTQAGAPVFPDILGSLTHSGGRAVQLLDHGPPHAERLLRAGQLRDRTAGRAERDAERRLSARARTASDHFRESERAVVHRRRAPTTAAVRIRPTATTASILRWPIRTTTARMFRSCSGR